MKDYIKIKVEKDKINLITERLLSIIGLGIFVDDDYNILGLFSDATSRFYKFFGKNVEYERYITVWYIQDDVDAEFVRKFLYADESPRKKIWDLIRLLIKYSSNLDSVPFIKTRFLYNLYYYRIKKDIVRIVNNIEKIEELIGHMEVAECLRDMMRDL